MQLHRYSRAKIEKSLRDGSIPTWKRAGCQLLLEEMKKYKCMGCGDRWSYVCTSFKTSAFYVAWNIREHLESPVVTLFCKRKKCQIILSLLQVGNR